MDGVLEKNAVKRVKQALIDNGLDTEITVLTDSARSAAEAASALGIKVGQIASSIIFKLSDHKPLLVITSGQHRTRPAPLGGLWGLANVCLHQCGRGAGRSQLQHLDVTCATGHRPGSGRGRDLG